MSKTLGDCFGAFHFYFTPYKSNYFQMNFCLRLKRKKINHEKQLCHHPFTYSPILSSNKSQSLTNEMKHSFFEKMYSMPYYACVKNHLPQVKFTMQVLLWFPYISPYSPSNNVLLIKGFILFIRVNCDVLKK